jgi:chromosome segregation ATPase
MDGPPPVKLESALKTVIAAVSGGNSDISYQIDDDVIVIREEELQTPQPTAAALSPQEDTQELIARRRDLSDAIQDLEMEMAGREARRQAIEEQIARTRNEADKKLAQDTVTKEFHMLVEMIETRLSQLRKQVDAGQLPESELAPAQENLTRARIELAKRQEELTKDAGGSRLDSLNSELSQMAIQTAEQKARLEVFRTQLDETHRRLARASAFDPQVARLRTAQQALNIAERQITELTNRQVQLQRPSVTVMAADGL